MAEFKTGYGYLTRELLKLAGVDGVTDGDKYSFEDGTLTIHDMPQTELDTLVASLDVAAIESNVTIREEIAALEQSIDTSRIRREYAEGMRKRLEGVSPTADEVWAIDKVRDVDNQIAALRAKLK